jgi:hypothetical protein
MADLTDSEARAPDRRPASGADPSEDRTEQSARPVRRGLHRAQRQGAGAKLIQTILHPLGQAV